MGRRLRAQVNRVVLLVGLVVALPVIALTERLHRGTGRTVAAAAIRALGAATGVRFSIDPSAAADNGPAVLVANHRSILDIPAVLLARPHAQFVAAAELFRIPLLGAVMRAFDCVPVDRADPARSRHAIDESTRHPAGDIVVFAEGGIRTGPLQPLRSGAFRIAIQTGRPIIPLAIAGSDTVLGPGRHLAPSPGTITVTAGAPIPTATMTLDDRAALRDTTAVALRDLLARTPCN